MLSSPPATLKPYVADEGAGGPRVPESVLGEAAPQSGAFILFIP
jgi:hypothetical protein